MTYNCTWIFRLNWTRLKIVHVFFSHSDCIGSNHVNLRTRFCFKNNARRVLRSPSARADNTMAKRKRTITDLQNTTQKTIISPTAIYFFHRKQKLDFYFLDIKKKSVNSLQIFIINFSLKKINIIYNTTQVFTFDFFYQNLQNAWCLIWMA